MQRLIFILLALLIASCGQREGGGKPAASGKAGEMIVVMNKARWEGQAGEIVRGVFASYVPMLPQAEPQFNLYQIEHTSFADLFQPHRNIFIVDFDPSLEKGRMELKRDQWSYPQMIINVKVPDEESLKRIMDTNGESFIEHYLKTERERLNNAYRRMINGEARDIVRERLKLDINVPDGFFVAKQSEDFVWLRQTGTRDELELGVMLSVRPYRDPDVDFASSTIWERRNSITRAHIPGTFPGTYMTTYPDIPPLFRPLSFNGMYAVEARGLWKVQNDHMGGPFINITFVDEKNGRIITLDGFVYAPKFDKRDYLRQVEALMYSVSVFSPEEEQTTQNPA